MSLEGRRFVPRGSYRLSLEGRKPRGGTCPLAGKEIGRIWGFAALVVSPAMSLVGRIADRGMSLEDHIGGRLRESVPQGVRHFDVHSWDRRGIAPRGENLPGRATPPGSTPATWREHRRPLGRGRPGTIPHGLGHKGITRALDQAGGTGGGWIGSAGTSSGRPFCATSMMAGSTRLALSPGSRARTQHRSQNPAPDRRPLRPRDGAPPSPNCRIRATRRLSGGMRGIVRRQRGPGCGGRLRGRSRSRDHTTPAASR
jgi:hypothetical protein